MTSFFCQDEIVLVYFMACLLYDLPIFWFVNSSLMWWAHSAMAIFKALNMQDEQQKAASQQ